MSLATSFLCPHCHEDLDVSQLCACARAINEKKAKHAERFKLYVRRGHTIYVPIRFVRETPHVTNI